MSFSYGHHHGHHGWHSQVAPPSSSPAPSSGYAPVAPSPGSYDSGQQQDSFQASQNWGQADSGPGQKAYVPPAGSWGGHRHGGGGYGGENNPPQTPASGPSPSTYTPTSPTPGDSSGGSPSPSYPTPGGSGNNSPTPGGTNSNPNGGPTPAPQPGGSLTGVVDGGGPKQLVLKNNDSKPMTIGLFENTGPGMNPNINDPNNKYTLQPGQSITLSMPDSWQGRAQRLTGKADDPATWAELNFENKNGVSKTWYDESLILGYNGALTIRPTHGNGGVAGTNKSILAGAPAGALKKDSNGNTVIDATESYTGTLNQDAINYFNQAVGNQIAYVRNFDNGAVRTSDDTSLTVDFYGA